MKTVRFSQVVARSGRPHVHSLWVAPEHDSELKAAQKTQRVMTVSPPDRGKADVGAVGFDAGQAKKGQILIFPKSLAKFANARVVGVKFDLVDQPPTHAARMAEALSGTGRAPKRRQPRSPKTTATYASAHAHPVARLQRAGDARVSNQPPLRQLEEAAPAPSSSVRRSKKRAAHRPPPHARRSTAPVAADDVAALRRVIRAALDELRNGKTVAAYQRLETALG